MELPGRMLRETVEHPELEPRREERTDFGVILTKVKMTVLSVDGISKSGHGEKKSLGSNSHRGMEATKWTENECSGWQEKVGTVSHHRVKIAKGFQEEGWG